jgi:hypothetical protein
MDLDSDNIYNHYKILIMNNNVLISHYGLISRDLIYDKIETIHSLDNFKEYSKSVVNKICLVLTEILQNISIHSRKDIIDGFNSYFLLIKEENNINIKAGNAISPDDAIYLQNKLNLISNYTDLQIREKIREKLQNEGLSSKGGAGLGLLTILKKSKRPLKYDIKEIDSNTFYYQLDVNILTEK